MSDKTNKERLQDNNVELQNIKTGIDNLPDNPGIENIYGTDEEYSLYNTNYSVPNNTNRICCTYIDNYVCVVNQTSTSIRRINKDKSVDILYSRNKSSYMYGAGILSIEDNYLYFYEFESTGSTTLIPIYRLNIETLEYEKWFTYTAPGGGVAFGTGNYIYGTNQMVWGTDYLITFDMVNKTGSYKTFQSWYYKLNNNFWTSSDRKKLYNQERNITKTFSGAVNFMPIEGNKCIIDNVLYEVDDNLNIISTIKTMSANDNYINNSISIAMGQDIYCMSPKYSSSISGDSWTANICKFNSQNNNFEVLFTINSPRLEWYNSCCGSYISFVSDDKKLCYMLFKPDTNKIIGYKVYGRSFYFTGPTILNSGKVLSDYYVYDGYLNSLRGTMPNNGALNYTPTTSQQTIPAGYTSGGIVGAVTSAIDSNIQAENIKKDVTILGVTGTYEGSGGITPNIFVQTTEPEIKKGLWLQTNKNYEKIVFDENVYYGDEWQSSVSTPVIPYNALYNSSVSIGNDIYVFGGATSINAGNETNSLTAYKYNILTNTWTQLTDIPYYFFFGGTTSVGTDIYIFGSHNSSYSKKAYKYDTLTDTYTKLTDIPFNYADMPIASIGTDIYLFGGGGWNVGYTAYKYDTLTDTYTKLSNIPYEFYYTSYEAVNTDIYLFGGYGGNKKAYKYDTLTNTYTQLSDIPYQFSGGSTMVIGTDIYLFGGNGGSKKVYKYNVLTDTYTQLSNAPHDISAGSGARSVCNVNGDIYVISYYESGNNNGTGIDIYHFNSKTYPNDNSLIIAQGRSGVGKTYNIGYAVELISVKELDTPLLYGLVDAWFYTTQDGLMTDIPTYYGDGTQWVNFKNPPSNNS